jgi:hypothetical protein
MTVLPVPSTTVTPLLVKCGWHGFTWLTKATQPPAPETLSRLKPIMAKKPEANETVGRWPARQDVAEGGGALLPKGNESAVLQSCIWAGVRMSEAFPETIRTDPGERYKID